MAKGKTGAKLLTKAAVKKGTKLVPLHDPEASSAQILKVEGDEVTFQIEGHQSAVHSDAEVEEQDEEVGERVPPMTLSRDALAASWGLPN